MSETAYSQPSAAQPQAPDVGRTSDVSQMAQGVARQDRGVLAPRGDAEIATSSEIAHAGSNSPASLASRVWGRRAMWLALGLALGVLAAAVLGLRWPGRASPEGTAQLVTESTAGDCADTAMTYTLHKTRDTARAAFRCMSGFVVRGVTEDDFIQEAERYPTPIAGDIRRVGEFTAPDGQRMVYFAVVGPSQTVAYTVYLDKDGKVWRVA